MSRGNGTEDRITPVEIPTPRAKRFTMGNGFRVKWATMVAVIVLLGAATGTGIWIWKASTAFGGKADVVRVEAVEKQVDSLVGDVRVIKNDIGWIRKDQARILEALEK